MTDTHTHLYMPDAYPDGGVEAVERAIEAGVTHLVFPCVNEASLPDMIRLQALFPDHITLAIGLHPTEVGTDWKEELQRMHRRLPGNFVAIGEVGIDLYHDRSMLAEQKEAFAEQLRWALQYKLPVLIHSRDALEETLEVIQSLGDMKPQMVFHSFTGTADDVRKIREVCDPYFGINGVVTFKNAPLLREALPEIGIDRILLETDSPWLSPAPKRGITNESSRIPYICDCIATTLGLSSDEVAQITDKNAQGLGI